MNSIVELINFNSTDLYLVDIDTNSIDTNRIDLSWSRLIDQSIDLNLTKLNHSLPVERITSLPLNSSIDNQQGNNSHSYSVNREGLTVLIWNNVDPSAQQDTNPDTIATFDRSGELTSLDRNDLIVQSIDRMADQSIDRSTNSYRIFNDSFLTIANSSNSKLEVRSYSVDSDQIHDLMTIYPFNSTNENIEVILPSSSQSFTIADSNSPFTIIMIWSTEGNNSPLPGQRACIAVVIDSFSFEVLDYIINSREVSIFDQTNSDLIVNNFLSRGESGGVTWRVIDRGAKFGGRLGDRCSDNSNCNNGNCVIRGVGEDRIGICYPLRDSIGINSNLSANGQRCGSNDNCASGNCYRSICRPIAGEGIAIIDTVSESNGVEWWVWVSIVLLALLAIIIVVVLINHVSSSNK